MGLPLYALKRLQPYLKGAKVLSLGYPDITATVEQIKKTFGVSATKYTNQGNRHDIKGRLPESVEFFEQMGATLECVDYYKGAGVERIVDLNDPHDLGKYDLVIDPGTLEHCFNIGQAIINAASAVKAGGRIFHISPMTMVNHGFYNICPTFFHDFYGQNGWEINLLEPLNSTGMGFDTTGRFYATVEYILCCLAQRRTEAALGYPQQTKYIKMNERKVA